MNKSSQAANLPQAANRPTLTGEGLTVRIPFPPAASLARALPLERDLRFESRSLRSRVIQTRSSRPGIPVRDLRDPQRTGARSRRRQFRNRLMFSSPSDIERATAICNPDADSWVAEFLAWWIDQET